MVLKKRFNIIENLLIFFSILIAKPYFFNNIVFSAEKIDIKSDINTDSVSLNHEDVISHYILGPGDVLKFEFIGLKIFNNQTAIDPEGNIKLQEIGLVKAEGKTVSELKLFLKKKYQEYIFDPDIEIEIINYRPLKIYLSGEIVQPGLYKVRPERADNSYVFPRLYEVLKLGEGFNNNANLENIEIIRINPVSKGGGKIKTNLDLLSLFDSGNQKVNIRLYDGDIINVTKSEVPIKEQILKINRTNISPENIVIFITGNAISPGQKTLKKGTSLTQALASGGGKKLFTGKIEFIRFNYDGSTSKDVFTYNPNAPINSRNNPILMNGDLINIKRTYVGATAEFLGELTSPILSVYGLYQLFSK